ncbi:MAG: hypothetical protein HC868_17405 [Sphingomonadales bacterium]|nr:hypothetical protein [Sphingomonadales bacterium]
MFQSGLLAGKRILVTGGGTGLDAALSMMDGKVVSEFDLEPLSLPAKVAQSKENGRFVYRSVRHCI